MGSPGPYQPPHAPPPGMPPGHHHQGGGNPLHGGVPWESSQGGFLSRWWETVSAANFKGSEFFAAVAQSDDAMPACLFSMTTTAIFMFVAVLIIMVIYSIFGAIFLGALASMGGGKLSAGMAGLGLVFMFIYLIVITVVYAVIGFILPWIGGGLHHLGLMIFGGVGQGKGYTDTVRAHAYAQAASLLWLCIPIAGGFVSLVFSIINHVNAYDEVHRCGGGKAFGAWVSPLLICCCCYAAFAMMAIGASGF